jgi:hypothetical protein
MPVNHLAFRIIAHTPIAIAAIENKANVMFIANSQPSSPIETAATAHTRLFFLYVGVLVVAALATAVLTVLVWRSGNKYTDAIRADAEARIAKVQADAQTESSRIDTASKERINQVATDSGIKIAEADKKAALANERAGILEKEAATARAETEKLHEQNLSTEQKLENERSTRMELEKSLAPRFIWYEKRGSVSNIDALKKFSGMSVRIECIPDFEARRAAINLGARFLDAGWKVVPNNTVVLREDIPFDGVTVERYLPADMQHKTMAEMNGLVAPQIWHSADVAGEIVRFLKSNGWEADASPSQPGELKPDEIKILVGFKPAPYFMPEQIKEFHKKYDATENKMNDDMQRLRQGDSPLSLPPLTPPPKK